MKKNIQILYSHFLEMHKIDLKAVKNTSELFQFPKIIDQTS